MQTMKHQIIMVKYNILSLLWSYFFDKLKLPMN